MPEERTQDDTIHVDARHDGRRVLLTQEDEDRFVLTCKEAVRAAKTGMGMNVLQDDIAHLFQHVGAWVNANAEQVHECWVGPRDGQIVVFVASRSPQYDFTLGDALCELDIQLAQKYQLVPCEVQQIPRDSINEFVDKEAAVHLIQHDTTPSRQVDAQSGLPTANL